MAQSNFPPKLKVGPAPLTVEFLKAVNSFDQPGKPSQFDDGEYWIARVEYQGTEYSLFCDNSFVNEFNEAGLDDGDYVKVWRVKEKGEFKMHVALADSSPKPVKKTSPAPKVDRAAKGQDVFNRLPVVTDALMNAAVKLNSIIPCDPDPAAIQATFATLFISWKELGYPLVGSELKKQKAIKEEWKEEDLSPAYEDEEVEY